MTNRASLGLAALLTLVVTRAPAATIDYLHVAAGVGSAAGGHAAVRFDDTIYHFQHHAPGWLVIERNDAEFFRWRYGVLENRTIRMARLDVDDDTYTRLRDQFNERYVRQRQHLSAHASLESERMRLARWLDDAHPPDAPLRGAGLFFADGRPIPPGDHHVPALQELLALVERQHGINVLTARRATIVRAIDQLRPTSSTITRPAIDATAPPTLGYWSTDRRADRYAHGYRFTDRLDDLHTQLVALDVLQHTRPVRLDMLRDLGAVAPPLARAERRLLAQLRRQLLSRLAALPFSPRPDWGFALLVGLARLQAIDASLASGRLVVVDTYATDAPVIDASRVRTTPFVAELATDARDDLHATRANVAAAGALTERAYARLEAAANRHLECTSGYAHGRDVRLQGATPAPSRSARIPALPRPRLDRVSVATALATAEQTEARSRRALDARYGYGLLRNNCVTEIFATIDTAFSPAESRRRLGGHVGPRDFLTFVPFASFDAVVDAYQPAEVVTLPSYRQRRLEVMREHEHPLRVRLRETSTLTSTVYRRNPHDPFFLFFTDDALLSRPLYGLANLGAGLGQTALGLLRAPLDHGAMFRRGLAGSAASVPELAFVSIRNGHMEYGRVATTAPARR